MGFLKCEKCGGYYELKEGEAIDDFEGCSCGGKFKYLKNIEGLESVKNSDSGDKSICPNCGTENLKNVKFCGSCGKPIKKPISPDPDKNKRISKKPLYCPNCGTENIRTSKICRSCGKPLNIIPEASKKTGSKLSKFSKYRNKRTKGILGTGIIGIALIAFLILWLPANVFANHYDDGYISFNYPNNWNIPADNNNTTQVFNELSNNGMGGNIVEYDAGNHTVGRGFAVGISILPIKYNTTEDINTTVNQTVGLNTNGSNITAPVNMSTGQTQNITVDVLEEALNNLNNGFFNGFVVEGSGKPDIYTKNGYTYYAIGPQIIENSSVANPGLYGKLLNETDYNTFITKDGFPYIIWIEMSYDETSNNQNNNEAYNGYKQIVNSFKIG